MNGLNKFLDRQRALAASYADFLQTLDPTRTVSLLDMLMGKAAAFSLTQTGFPWLDRQKFREALENACDFLDGIPMHPRIRDWNNTPFVFLQISDPEEDQAELTRRCKEYELVRARHSGHPPDVYYGPTEGNCSGQLVGPPQSQRIAPLSMFTSHSPMFERTWFETRSDKPLINGYRVPKTYPEALSMSPLTSTAWLAKTVTHDIGHFFLPSVVKYEGVHNIVMVQAMKQSPQCPKRIPHIRNYNKLMRHAAEDPYFFLYAEDAISECRRKGGLKPVCLYFLDKLERCYSRPTRFTRWERIWGITEDMDFRTRCERVNDRINSLKRDGFALYDS